MIRNQKYIKGTCVYRFVEVEFININFYLTFLVLGIVLSLISCNKEMPNKNEKSKWIENAFRSLKNNRYPKVKAISWWNENFDNSLLRVNTSIESLMAYKDGVNSAFIVSKANIKSNKLVEPKSGIYHAAYPDFGGTEDVVSKERIIDFESLVDKDLTWAYFSNNWYNNIHFPSMEVAIIKSTSKIPFIRIMPRSNFEVGGPDPNYTLQNIIDGKFDLELTQWALDASKTNTPLLAEFGTEVNGNWFPWNGQYNGAGDSLRYGDKQVFDGAERFIDAYRHIIDICNLNEAYNITWFYHVDAYSYPNVNWNQMELYYPGDTYIDWLGVSIYGPQQPNEAYHEFSDIMNDIYPRLIDMSDKPIAILEFAITELN